MWYTGPSYILLPEPGVPGGQYVLDEISFLIVLPRSNFDWGSRSGTQIWSIPGSRSEGEERIHSGESGDR